MVDRRAEIFQELIVAGEHLGAKSDLIGLIGSYAHRTLSDEDVLTGLRKRNRARGIEPTEFAEAHTVAGAIRDELYLAFEALGAGAGILCAICSWGDFESDDQVLTDLRGLNTGWVIGQALRSLSPGR